MNTVPAVVPWREVATFLAVTFTGVTLIGLLWYWIGDIHDERHQLIFGGAAMFTPALGAVVAFATTGAIRRPREFLTATGMLPLRPWPRLLRYLAIGLILPPAVLLTTLGIGALLGTFRFHSPIRTDQLLSVLAVSLVTFLPSLILMLGEEIGWGYLLPRLLPLGLWPGVLLSGTIWGLFHAPLTLQGYAYPALPGVLATGMFTIAHVLLGALMAWIRLESGSLWPAVMLHGASNMIANPLPGILGQSADPTTTDLYAKLPTAWPSWLVMATLILILAAAGRYRHAYHASNTSTEPTT